MRPSILTNEKIIDNCKYLVRKLVQTYEGRKLAEAVSVIFPKSYTDMCRVDLREAHRALTQASKTLDLKPITDVPEIHIEARKVTAYLIDKGYGENVKTLLSKYGVKGVSGLCYQTGKFYLSHANNLLLAIRNEEKIRTEISLLVASLSGVPLATAVINTLLNHGFQVPNEQSLKVHQLTNFLDRLNYLKIQLSNNETMNKPTTKNKNFLISGAQGVGKSLLAELINGGTYLVDERSNKDTVSFADILEVPQKLFDSMNEGASSDKIIVDECDTSHERFNEIVEAFKKKYKVSIFITQDKKKERASGLFDFNFSLK